jgi:cation-transporting P-type ATPase 13A2
VLGDHAWFNDKEEYNTIANSSKFKYLEGMASCNWVSMVKDNLIGDPVDVEMFRWTEWVLDESPNELAYLVIYRNQFELACVYPQDISHYMYHMLDAKNKRNLNSSLSSASETSSEGGDIFIENVPYSLAIIKRFSFNSKLARMSVIVKNKKDGNYRVYTKGAPENIRRLCIEDSVPSTFHDILKKYTEKGLRVLALAYKELPNVDYFFVSELKRSQVEYELRFLGLILLNNELKQQTVPTINALHKAKIRTIMATGDNPLTSISVARESGIIDPSRPVFLGELVTLKDGEKRLTWNNIDKFDSKLDPKTLFPLNLEEEELKRQIHSYSESSSIFKFK